MTHRFFLAILLSLPCLALTGCGNSASKTEVNTEPLSEAEIAAVKADMERVQDEERAHFEAENPKAAKKR